MDVPGRARALAMELDRETLATPPRFRDEQPIDAVASVHVGPRAVTPVSVLFVRDANRGPTLRYRHAEPRLPAGFFIPHPGREAERRGIAAFLIRAGYGVGIRRALFITQRAHRGMPQDDPSLADRKQERQGHGDPFIGRVHPNERSDHRMRPTRNQHDRIAKSWNRTRSHERPSGTVITVLHSDNPGAERVLWST